AVDPPAARPDRGERGAAARRARPACRPRSDRRRVRCGAADRCRLRRTRRVRELMAKELYSASEAASALGISLDTLRRWDKTGRIKVHRDSANRRVVEAAEIERVRGDGDGAHISARNRLRGIVTNVQVEGLMAQVELVVNGPVRLVAVVTRD